MLIKINKFVQVLLGYVLIAILIEVLVTLILGHGNGIFKMMLFFVFAFEYEITPHPTNETNPFAFGIIDRWTKYDNRKDESKCQK